MTVEYTVCAVIQKGMTIDNKLTDSEMPFYCLAQLRKEQKQHQHVQ